MLIDILFLFFFFEIFFIRIMPSSRVHYRRRSSYHTQANTTKIVKTPGGRLSVHYKKKTGDRPKCGDCGSALAGIPALRPTEYANISRRQKTVARAYGGSRCAHCVKDRIIRAFLLEEQKIVKKVKKTQTKQ